MATRNRALIRRKLRLTPLNAVTPVTPVDYFGALAALPPPPEMVYNRLLALLGRFSSLFSCLLGLLAASCLAKALQKVKKRPPGSILGAVLQQKIEYFVYVSAPLALHFAVRFSNYFRNACALRFVLFGVSAKNGAMPCDPQKPMDFHDFSMFAWPPGAPQGRQPTRKWHQQ